MSFYRSIIAAVAAMGLAASVFAADESTTQTTTGDTTTTTTQQTADASSTQGTEATTEQSKVDVNKATAKELMKVRGLNVAKAKAIVAYRKKHGDFKSLDELKEVKGFKKMNDESLKEIQDQLTVG